jgi:hypothetical protein
MADLGTAFSKLFGYVDGHIATVGAASLDASLEGALLTKFRPLSQGMKDRLFRGYGPLANLASKIDMAFALNIISDEVYDKLRAINSVRVAFAHSKRLTSFSDPEISSRLSNLKLDGNEPGIKFRFLAKLSEVEEQLRAVTDPEHQISEAFAISSRSST